MRQDAGRAATEVLLLGGGHAHAVALADLARRPAPGLSVTLVAREMMALYSGMLPGVVAGRQPPEAIRIDLARLAAAAGARLVAGAATAIDPAARRVTLADGRSLAYDLLSVDVGITPDLDGLCGAADHAVPLKPVSTLLARWGRLEAAALAPDGPRRFAVVGGGPAGFETVLAVAARLRAGAAERGLAADALGFTLISAGPLLAGLAPGAARHGRRALDRAGVSLAEGDAAVAVDAAGVTLASGRRIAADAVLAATGAAAPAWFRGCGLPLDAAGCLRVGATLQVVGHPDILAAGDCAAMDGAPRPKAGVFAVRQGPVLADALRRLASGRTPRPYRPQRRFLTLLSTADGRAIAAWGGLSAEGRWVFAWKERLDHAFLRRVRF